MKKLAVVLVSALAAGLFFGCSDSSDSNNMGLLLAAGGSNGGSSNTAVLPASVGTNPFAGNSYTTGSGSYSTTYKFEANTFTATQTSNYAANETAGTKAYTVETIASYPYSYNAETKNIYYIYAPSNTVYKNAEGKHYEAPASSFTSEEEYFESQKKVLKGMYDVIGKTFNEEEFNVMKSSTIQLFRMSVYYATYMLKDGYTDSTGATPATSAQIAKFNQYSNLMDRANKKTVTCRAYDFDADNNLKLANEGNLPAGIKFGGIYNGTYSFSANITNYSVKVGSISVNLLEVLDPNNSIGAANFEPSIKLGDGDTAEYLKITSVSDDSVTGFLQARTGYGTVNAPYVYTNIGIEEPVTLKFENTTTAEKTTVTIKMQVGDSAVTFGTFEIPYNNSISSYSTYTKCN